VTAPLDRTTCHDAFSKLDDFLDRRLSPEEARLIEEHLKVCEACTREFAFEASVLEHVRRKLARIETPPGLVARIAEQIARAAREAGERPAG
jgi:anti-sigma factor (TIGR02949 family)